MTIRPIVLPAMVLLAALSVVACGGPSPDNEAPPAADGGAGAELASGVFEEYMDRSVDPGDDFHAFVNGGWIETAEIPADKASYGAFQILRERSEEDVRAIIEKSAEGDFAKGSDEQKVGDLFASYLDTDTRNELGIAPLQPEFERIDALENYDDLAVYFAEANKLGINTPFQLLQYVDFKDPDTYMMYTWQGGLGMPDREFYVKDDEPSADIRAKYVAHIEAMFELAELPDAEQAAEMIMALETRMANQHMLKEKTRDMVALYNRFPMAELTELLPNFNWDAYIEAAGVDFVDGLVVTQTDYMKALDGIIQETSLEDWKTFLKWKALDANASRLDEALDRQNFEFYSKTLNGIEAPLPLWRRGVNAVNGTLGEVVGRIYVDEHFPPAAKERMAELVDNLLAAYEKSIKELDWMGEETRAEALDKLSKFTPKIGYPDEWRDYSKLDIEPDDLYGNLQRAALANYERNLERQSGPVDRGEWAMTPQTVNAYYNPPLNEIVFPAAILQPPFFDMEADDAVNYGAIGAVIGHEIGHGFDDAGSTFDGDGVLRNWWTDEDRERFEELTGRLVEQYGSYKPFDDLSLNGEFTLGENIGDLGGLGIGLMAYEMSLDGEEAPVIDDWTGRQRVFIGYAQVWRGKFRDEALRNYIATDPHSPGRYRTNGVVRNVEAFYEEFEVDETDELYLPPEERVKIW